jgi:3-ketosteroid 9alpha-monooxygenase subunit B
MASTGGVRDHGYHALRVARVVPETADASSFVLDIPEDLAERFTYEAGQFLTFRARIGEETHLRCYSMSSSPAVDDDLQVTVKRVPGGVVSNWMIDTLEPGSSIEATYPAGVFCLGSGDADLVAFSGGSGITPVFSLVKAALATTSRRVRLLYANRDRDSVIFGGALDALTVEYPDRIEVVHRLDVEDGFVDAGAVRPFVTAGAEYYVCGPGPFMDIVEGALLGSGVPAEAIHIERFTPTELEVVDESAPVDAQVTIELDGRKDSTAHHPGTTILQTARQMGMSPPFSCESGSCASCMARLVEGTVEMRVNNALTPDEVEEGWVLTCQSVPTSSSVHVVYGYD